MSTASTTARGLGLLLPAAWLAWCVLGGGSDMSPTAPAVPDAEQDAHSERAQPPRATPPDASETAPSHGAEAARELLGSAASATPAFAPQSPPVPTAPTLVRVTVRLDAGVPDCGLPVPELLRLGPDGEATPVGGEAPPPTRHPALELAAKTARGEPARTASEASRAFEVREPGRYVAAWHLWLQVPGTKTWRVQRGRGPELRIWTTGGERELVVDVGTDQLRLDPSLDERDPNAIYRVTPKDG